MKISVKALALSLGICWGLALFAVTLVAVFSGGYLQPFADFFVGIYPYYTVTAVGSIVGLIWGFVDGFIGGLILGWVYNLFAPGSAS